jgi:hypothetical protein
LPSQSRTNCLFSVVCGLALRSAGHPHPEFLALFAALFSRHFAAMFAGFALAPATCFPVAKERTCQWLGFNTPENKTSSFGETENAMNAELDQQIHQLRQMTTAQLQRKYCELFGSTATCVPIIAFLYLAAPNALLPMYSGAIAPKRKPHQMTPDQNKAHQAQREPRSTTGCMPGSGDLLAQRGKYVS